MQTEKRQSLRSLMRKGLFFTMAAGVFLTLMVGAFEYARDAMARGQWLFFSVCALAGAIFARAIFVFTSKSDRVLGKAARRLSRQKEGF